MTGAGGDLPQNQNSPTEGTGASRPADPACPFGLPPLAPAAELTISDGYSELAGLLETSDAPAPDAADTELDLDEADLALVPPAQLEAFLNMAALYRAGKAPPPLTLEDVARMFDLSLPPVRDYVNRVEHPMPYRARGRSGVAYHFDALDVLRWQCRDSVRQARDEERRVEAIGQTRLKLFGGQALTDPAMSRADVAADLRAEYEATRLAALRREFVPAAVVKAGLRDVLNAIRNQLRALPDQVAAELGLDTRQREGLLVRIDNLLTDTADQIATIQVDQAPAIA